MLKTLVSFKLITSENSLLQARKTVKVALTALDFDPDVLYRTTYLIILLSFQLILLRLNTHYAYIDSDTKESKKKMVEN